MCATMRVYPRISPNSYLPLARGILPIDLREELAVKPISLPSFHALYVAFARFMVLNGESLTRSLFQGNGLERGGLALICRGRFIQSATSLNSLSPRGNPPSFLWSSQNGPELLLNTTF